MSIINANNLSKSYKIHEKQEGLKNTIKDLFNRKYVYKNAVNNLNMTIEKGEIVFLIPSVPLANIPASLLLNKGNIPGMIAAAVSGMLFFLISAAAIKKGIRKYSSASS